MGCLLGNSLVGLMVTSSKRAYARGCVTQVCCTQSPCPCGKPLLTHASAAAAAKSLQLCATLCDPIDGSLPGPSVLGILQARILEWVDISFSTCLCRRLKHRSGSVSVGLCVLRHKRFCLSLLSISGGYGV